MKSILKIKRSIAFVLFSLLALIVNSQALPIYIDGTYSDWGNAIHIQDDETEGDEIDFTKFTVTNDNDFLYLKIEFSNEIDLTDNNEIYVDIDADNNVETGWEVNGIGSEMDWNFGQKFGYLNEGGSWDYISFPDIQLRLLPTVTSSIFEIAIGRHVKPNGTDFLFTSDTIKICFINDVSNGDHIPNEGEFFTYVFDDTFVDPPAPILLQKEDEESLRLMTYNIQNDFNNNIGGLDDPERIPNLERIFTALAPDIITINECWNVTTTRARNFLNDVLPPGTSNGWYANRLDGGNITASKYPIAEAWLVHPGSRITACLIDLPESFPTDILVLSAHFKCCDDDPTRQLEADAFASFILDAKTPGGMIDLPQNTPFVLMGDLNLVGLSQQLTTLLTGDIQDTYTFGNGAPPDWDDSDLEDLISRQTDKRMAYTWRNDWGSYPPGRLDFMIYSNSVMQVEKAFTLQTEVMPTERLELYGLAELDTKTASDHFPKVADFILETTSSAGKELKPDFRIHIFPNPTSDFITISLENMECDFFLISLLDVNGAVIKEFSQSVITRQEIDLSQLQKGVYFLKVETSSNEIYRQKILKF
jgi:endonuclease/exonuclease/phosphatase family metal-dependent hydrolase